MKKTQEQIVILRWTKKVLKKAPLMWIPPQYEGTYRTGQEIVPGDPKTVDNLTVEQMTGKKSLTAEQMRKFPIVINPDNTYYFHDGRRFNKDKTEDMIHLNFLLCSYKRIASSIAVYNSVLHDGYIEDQEAESKMVVDNTNQLYDALTLIKNRQIDEVMEAALYTNHAYNDSEIDIKKMSQNQIYGELYKIAKVQPDLIIKAFSEEARKSIFVLKLEAFGILNRRDGIYYEGQRYLGNSVVEVSEYLQRQENIATAERLRKILNQKENKGTIDESVAYDEIIVKIESALYRKDVFNGQNLIALGLRSYPGDKTILDLQERWKVLKGEVDDSEGTAKKEKLRSELSDMSIDELRVKAGAYKNKGIKKTDLEGKNREEIIELILSKF